MYTYDPPNKNKFDSVEGNKLTWWNLCAWYNSLSILLDYYRATIQWSGWECQDHQILFASILVLVLKRLFNLVKMGFVRYLEYKLAKIWT